MSLSPEARECLARNPDLFLTEYFSHRINKLEPFHLDLIRAATTEIRGLILFPAGHGKTTIVSELLPIWAFSKDPNIRIADIAKNDIDAKAITRSIQTELLQNDKLIRDWGPFYPDGQDGAAWSLERFDVAKRTRRGKSSTWAAFGAGSRNALGYRVDWGICDDVVTDQNSSTPEQRGKLREWFNQGPETMGDEANSRLTVVGTLFHPEDLYHDLQLAILPDGVPMYHVERHEAIQNWETQEVLWPEYRPWMWLMQRKLLMGTLDFNKRYQNIAVDASRMVFREEYVRGGYIGRQFYPGCLDREYTVGEYLPEWRRVAGFDPAVGTKSHSNKFCAHIVIAAGSCAKHEKCYWVVDLHRDQMTLPQQVEMILEEHEKYDLNKTLIEANSYQAGLYQAVQDKMNDRHVRWNVEPHYTNRTNKPDPELGVQAMSPWFENGQVHIPWGNPESQRKMQIFVDELVQYPGRTTDTVMAMWFAWKQLKETAPKYMSFNRLAKDQRRSFYSRRPFAGRMTRNPYYDTA